MSPPVARSRPTPRPELSRSAPLVRGDFQLAASFSGNPRKDPSRVTLNVSLEQ